MGLSYRKFFAILFIISLFVFLFFQFYPKTIHSPQDTHTLEKTTHIEQKASLPSISIEPEIIAEDEDFILVASLTSSILSFFGFLISSFYSHKGHRRDEELYRIRKERERLEMEKIRAEINALQGESS